MGWGDAPRAKAWASDLKYIDKRLRALDIRFDSIHSPPAAVLKGRTSWSAVTSQHLAKASGRPRRGLPRVKTERRVRGAVEFLEDERRRGQHTSSPRS